MQLDGRIEPGDMILQVNDINFENMTNDEAVKVLREVVQKPGPVKLVVAKCWDPNPKGERDCVAALDVLAFELKYQKGKSDTD